MLGRLSIIIVLVSLVVGPQPASSAVGPSAALMPSFTNNPSAQSNLPSGLVLNLERMIQARWVAMGLAVPTPIEGASPSLIAQRLSVLRDLNDFAHMTISGLATAANGSEGEEDLIEQLDGLLERWSVKVAGAMSDLLDHPLVSSEGWFTISRFGVLADRNGVHPALQGRVLKTLIRLAPKGETDVENIELLVHRIAPVGDEHAASRGD